MPTEMISLTLGMAFGPVRPFGHSQSTRRACSTSRPRSRIEKLNPRHVGPDTIHEPLMRTHPRL